jgi:hypothetical protein
MKTPTFVSIAQPEYAWAEREHQSPNGETGIPMDAAPIGTIATIIVPEIKDYGTRAVRLHELLHARFTPEVNELATIAKKAGSIEPLALQLAEDVRINRIAADLGLWSDEVQYKGGQRLISPMEQAHRFMSDYGSKIDTYDSKSVEEFVGEVCAGTIRTDVRRILERWARKVDAVFKGETDPKEIFLALSQLTDKALHDIAYPPPPPKNGDGEDGDGEKDGDEDEGEEDEEEGEEDDQADEEDGDEEQKQEDDKSEQKASKKKPKKSQSREGSSLFEKLFPGLAKKQAKPKKSAEKRIAKKSWGKKALKDSGMALPKEAFKDFLPPPPPQIAPVNRDRSPDFEPPFELNEKWGQMTVHMGELRDTIRAYVRRAGRATTSGVVPIHWSRWYADKAVFDRRGRRLGGTLLIDVSGSMDWAHDKLVQLVEATPAMTVAIYSGAGPDDLGGTAGQMGGRLTVIAKNGKRSAHLQTTDLRVAYRHGGANIVDGPALVWLTHQQEPRVWFSDGKVTGTREAQDPLMLADADRLCRLANIKRTLSMEEVADILSRQLMEPYL